MNYNLTEIQKKLAHWIVEAIRDHKIEEAFACSSDQNGGFSVELTNGERMVVPGGVSAILCLEADDLLKVKEVYPGFLCAIRQRIYKAVDTNFAEDESTTPISTLAQPHPPEIAMSLDRLRTKYPDPKKVGFLIMRFTAAKPFGEIIKVIKKTAEKHGLIVIRADEQEFHADLWGNVRTYLHGCGFGIAIYERIQTDEPNANVGLEVGYLMAMNKPVLLLKDKTVETLQADLAGKLYKTFDPHDPQDTIPEQLTKWLTDYGIIVPKS